MRPPTGTVTFLFTDIEGSTRMWEAHRNPMQAAVRKHDAILRGCIEANSGYVFKTVGDAFCASFSSAPAALAAALSIRSALAAEDWGSVPIKVRIGLHAGTAEEREGDYFGPTVNRAARISAAASGGQIILSSAVRELLTDQLLLGTTVQDLGVRRLKDLSAPERIWQANNQGFPTEFPPLHTLDVRPNNLPVQFTAFIGREKEKQEILELLAHAHLVTLVGPGGTGKTRLALECAAALADLPKGGIWFVDFSRITDPQLVESTVAQAIGMQPDPNTPLSEALVCRFRDQEALLIFDNCEHLIQRCAELAGHFLGSCPRLAILATSREELMIQAETTYRLDPLSAPLADSCSSTIQALSQYEAVKLFIDRARAVRRDFPVDESTAPWLAEICARVEGIPMALELAAAQLKFMGLKDLAGKLGTSLAFLHSTARDATRRQSTLKALIDWSWNLLSPEERDAWCSLSLFRGGFTLEAAETMLGTSAAAIVEGLVSKSIVRMEDTERGARYSMLDTLLSYGQERLRESGAVAGARDKFLGCWIAFAKTAAPKLFVISGREIFDVVDLEMPNIRAAFAMALEDDALVPQAMQMACALYDYFWSGRANSHESIDLWAKLRQKAGSADERAKAFLLMGEVARKMIVYEVDDEALSQCLEAEEHARKAEDALLAARAVLLNATTFYCFAKYADGVTESLRALTLPVPGFRERVRCQAYALIGAGLWGTAGLGNLHNWRALLTGTEAASLVLPDDEILDVSIRVKKRAREYAEAVGDVYWATMSLSWLADEYLDRGDLASARSYMSEGVTRLLELGFVIEPWQTLSALSLLETMAGDYPNALQWIEKNAEISQRLGIASAEVLTYDMRADVERAFGHWKAAEEAYRGTLEAARARNYVRYIGNYRSGLGQVLIETGKLAEAKSLLAPRLKYLKETYPEEKHPYIFFPIAVLLAGNARIMLATRSGGEAPARFAGAVFGFFLNTKCPKADPRYLSDKPDEWEAIEGADWIQPWLVNWRYKNLFPTRHVFQGLLRELKAAFDKKTLVRLLNEGKEAGLDAMAEECIRVNG